MLALLVSSLASAADPADGKSAYAANCATCHGRKGNGKGPAAIALKPKPTNFTEADWWVGRTDEQISASIRAGKPDTAMPPFPDLSDAQVADIVAHLRTFGPQP